MAASDQGDFMKNIALKTQRARESNEDFEIDDDGEADTRICTDTLCLLLFILFLAGFAGILHIAITAPGGGIDKLYHGFDWQGRICGVDEAVKDRKFLFWCNPEGNDLSDGICVQECPTSSEQKEHCPGIPSAKKTKEEIKPGVEVATITISRELTLTNVYASDQFMVYCIPRDDEALLQKILLQGMPSGTMEQIAVGLDAIYESKRFLIGVGVVSTLAGYVFLLLSVFLVTCLIYIAICVVGLGLVGGCGFFAYLGLQPMNFLSAWFTDYQMAAWVCSAACFILFVAFAILVMYIQEAIEVTRASIREIRQIILNQPTVLFAPGIQSTLKFVCSVMLLIGLGEVLSLGKVHTNALSQLVEGNDFQASGLLREIVYSPSQYFFILYYTFGMAWVLETITGLGNYVMSHVAVFHTIGHTTHHVFPLSRGYTNGIVYHLGTCAFGGFVVGMFRWITALVGFFHEQVLGADKTNPAIEAAAGAFTCCLQCFIELQHWVNALAYTDTAINGTDYPQAVRNVARMGCSVEHAETFAVVKGATDAMRQMGMVLIPGSVTYLAWWIQNNDFVPHEFDGVKSNLMIARLAGVTFAAALISFHIARSFMVVLSELSEAIMYCILWKKDNGIATDIPAGWIKDSGMYARMDR